MLQGRALVDLCFNLISLATIPHPLIFVVRSVSSLLTTTEAAVVELPSEKETPAMDGGMGGGMGGMDY